MKYKKIFILILVLMFIVLYNVSRAVEKWRSLTDELPNKFIKDIKTDRGTVYIATANGVAIYDTAKGKVTRVLQAGDGLGDNFVSCIAVDNEYIWIGTDNGLSRYEKKTGKIINFTKNDGLVDNAVSAIAVDDDYIWVGTKYWGLSRYDKVVNNWKSFTIMDGLIDNSINCITVEGGFVWVGTKSGLNYFDKIIGMWGGYDTSQGLQEGNVRSIEVAGQNLWLGTVNGLIRFDKNEETFKQYTSAQGLADDYVQNLKLDGSYLWIGTFSGVTKYNILKEDWYTYTVKDGLIENSVSCLELDGNYIWLGTDGYGISIFDKDIPQATISPFSYYNKPGNITIMGTAFDYDNVASYLIEYKNDAMKDYVAAGIKILNNNNVIQNKLAEWDVSKLFNINYEVRLTVTDKKGNNNIAINTITVDTTPPEITLDLLPEAVKALNIFIKGSFNDNNISKIMININNKVKEKADLNKILKQYSKEIQLESGRNTVTITAYDVANLFQKISNSVVYDKEKPVITLKDFPAVSKERDITLNGTVIDSGIQRIILNPGNIEIPFNRNNDGSFSFNYQLSLDPGQNKYEISAYDFVGNKTTVEPLIEYTSSLPIVSLDKSVLRTSEPEYEVKGKWSDDNIDYISIEPGNKKAQIDTGNRTFSLKIKLEKGENVLTANIVDKDGNKTFDIVTVLYSTEKTGINIANLPEYTFQKNIKLDGTYTDPNLDRIILNPGGITVPADVNSKTFSIKLDLNIGTNNYQLTLQDKSGTKTRREFGIVLDIKPPAIELAMVPTTVYADKLEISGKCVEDYLKSVIIQPGNIICKINNKDNTFSGTIKLKEGKNQIQVAAFDKAGNQSAESKLITFIPKALAADTQETIDSDYVKKLKAEIEHLKMLLKNMQPSGEGTTVVYREETYTLPLQNGLAIVPFSKLKTDSLFEVSKKYLGNYVHIDFINKYNNTGRVIADNTILLPTRKYIRDYMRIDDRKIREILDIIAISFKSSDNSTAAFKQKLAFNLFRKDIISKNGFDFLMKNGYIKGNEFLVSVNRNMKDNHPYVINVTYNRSFMNIDIGSNKLYGRK